MGREPFNLDEMLTVLKKWVAARKGQSGGSHED